MTKNRPSGKLMANDELFLQPWFLPKQTYLTLKKLLPSSQLAKMRYYFEDYGCLKCCSRSALYGSNGLCVQCSIIVRGRVALSLKKRFGKIGVRVDGGPLVRYGKRLASSRTSSR